jgi:hypothetical protein
MASHEAAMSRQHVRLDPMTAALAATPPVDEHPVADLADASA